MVPLFSAAHPLLLLHWVVCTAGAGAAVVLVLLVWPDLCRGAPEASPLRPPITILRPFDDLDPRADRSLRDPGRFHYPLAHAPLAISILSLPLAIAGAPQDLGTALLLSAGLLLSRIAWSGWALARAGREPASPSLLWEVPLNEGVMLVAWVAALFARTMRWRSQRFRLLPGGRVERIDA